MFSDKTNTHNPVKIFYSYVIEDKQSAKEIDIYLTPFKNNGLIDTWSESNTLAGDTLSEVAHKRLLMSDIVIFMLSPNFLASSHFVETYKKTVQIRKSRKIHIVPVLVRECLWRVSVTRHLQIIPKNQVPISGWNPKEAAYNAIAEELFKLINTKINTHPKKEVKQISITVTLDEESSDSDKKKLLRGLELFLGISKGRINVDGIELLETRNQKTTELSLKMSSLTYRKLKTLEEIGSLKRFNIAHLKIYDTKTNLFDTFIKNIQKRGKLGKFMSIMKSRLNDPCTANNIESDNDWEQTKIKKQDYPDVIGDFRNHNELYKSEKKNDFGDITKDPI